MNKSLIFLFVFSMFAFKSFADQPYFLVEINCYPKSEYFEIRYFETHNLEMYNNKNENNLYTVLYNLPLKDFHHQAQNHM